MRSMYPTFAALLSFVALAGTSCASASLHSAEDFRAENRRNIARLRIGMAREEVIATMGTQSLGRPLGSEAEGPVRAAQDTAGVTQLQIPLGGRSPTLQNPMRTATYATADSRWEILFYYTDVVEDDGIVTDDELTPVVLREDMLVGIGWEFWVQEASSNGIEIARDPSTG